MMSLTVITIIMYNRSDVNNCHKGIFVEIMSRWKPDAKGRLEQAALDLFQERGFEQTTVAEIAERAGLTERTFFRYFADKREVLFGSQSRFQDIVVNAIVSQPDTATPINMIIAALDVLAATISDRLEFVRQSQAIIATNPELQERELLKRATLISALAQAMQERGISEQTANMTIEIGMVAYKAAFVRWFNGTSERTLPQLLQDSLEELKSVLTS